MTNYNGESIFPKPPLGIMPEKIHTELRVLDLLECIARNVRSSGTCDKEWIEELNRKIVIKEK